MSALLLESINLVLGYYGLSLIFYFFVCSGAIFILWQFFRLWLSCWNKKWIRSKYIPRIFTYLFCGLTVNLFICVILHLTTQLSAEAVSLQHRAKVTVTPNQIQLQLNQNPDIEFHIRALVALYRSVGKQQYFSARLSSLQDFNEALSTCSEKSKHLAEKYYKLSSTYGYDETFQNLYVSVWDDNLAYSLQLLQKYLNGYIVKFRALFILSIVCIFTAGAVLASKAIKIYNFTPY